jgi:hypothetical protein
VRSAGAHALEIEPYSPWLNRAETAIKALKRMTNTAMTKSGAPLSLWDICLELQGHIRSSIAHDIYALNDDVPNTAVSGDTSDISHLCELSWYDWLWYHDPIDFPEDKRKLGRWLGPSHDIGHVMCARVLAANGQILARTTYSPLSVADHNSESVKKRQLEFDESIKTQFGNPDRVPVFIGDPDEFEPYSDDSTGDEATMPEADDYDHDAFDQYINAEVLLPVGDSLLTGKVIARKKDRDGNPVGRSNANPILDSRVLEVQFNDGVVKEFAANVIAEHIYSQVDNEGRRHLILDEIIDHRKDGSAVAPDDLYDTDRNGNQHMRRTTKGWKLSIQWKDGSASWLPLKDLKESNPVEVAEYAVANKLVHEPAFAWWVPHTLRKRDNIVSAVKTRYQKKTHKFGIRIPKTVREALEIDRDTNTSLWADAIKKEMKNVMPAFKILDPGAAEPVGHTRIPCHMIFDIKMDFTRKARLVAGGHVTDPPSSITYASVVSRDSVRLAFLIAALNDLDILGADAQNAYLNAPVREKVYTTCGPEFGPSCENQYAIIVRALYGLKSSGAAWRAHLASTMQELNFISCLADPDVWLRPAQKADGTEHYEYVLIYTDDFLCISSDPRNILDSIGKHFKLKPDSIKPPDHYLGANIAPFSLPDNPTKERWSMSSTDYVKQAVKNVERDLHEIGRALSNRASSPMSTSYRPELDVSTILDPDRANYFQSQIGVLRWAVELGRIDIMCEVSMLSSFLAMPREGHLTAVFNVFAYLKSHNRSRLVFDDTYAVINNQFKENVDWTDFYGDVKEPIPPNAPQARGKAVEITTFVDADHAGDRVTRRSRTGVLIYVNRAPIMWFSKRQNSVETSTFGSEFVALKTATEMIQGLRYKLRMMGIPIDGAARVLCDNMSVVYNTTAPESMLKKKSNAIAYHFVRECVAAKVIKIAYEPTDTNLADALTKVQPAPKRQELIRQILW